MWNDDIDTHLQDDHVDQSMINFLPTEDLEDLLNEDTVLSDIRTSVYKDESLFSFYEKGKLLWEKFITFLPKEEKHTISLRRERFLKIYGDVTLPKGFRFDFKSYFEYVVYFLMENEHFLEKSMLLKLADQLEDNLQNACDTLIEIKKKITSKELHTFKLFLLEKFIVAVKNEFHLTDPLYTECFFINLLNQTSYFKKIAIPLVIERENYQQDNEYLICDLNKKYNIIAFAKHYFANHFTRKGFLSYWINIKACNSSGAIHTIEVAIQDYVKILQSLIEVQSKLDEINVIYNKWNLDRKEFVQSWEGFFFL